MTIYQTDRYVVNVEPTIETETYLITIKAPKLNYYHENHIRVQNGKTIEHTALRYAQSIAKSLYLEAKSIYENIHPDI